MVRTLFNIQYIHNLFYDYKMHDGFLFHSNILNALVLTRFGCVFYGGFANNLLSPFLFGIFITFRSGMRPKHEHTVDTLTAYVLQCWSLISFRLFPSNKLLFIFINMHRRLICFRLLDIYLLFSIWYGYSDRKKIAENDPLCSNNFVLFSLFSFVHICLKFGR